MNKQEQISNKITAAKLTLKSLIAAIESHDKTVTTGTLTAAESKEFKAVNDHICNAGEIVRKQLRQLENELQTEQAKDMPKWDFDINNLEYCEPADDATMVYVVRLADGTIGKICSDTIDGQHANAFIGEVVNVHFYDDNGANIERQGKLVAVINAEKL